MLVKREWQNFTLSILTQQHPDALPLDDPCWSFLDGMLRPFKHLTQANLMLDGGAINHDVELRHGRRRGHRFYILLPKLRERQGNRLIERIGLNINRMRDSIHVVIANAAPGHAFQYIADIRPLFAIEICGQHSRNRSFMPSLSSEDRVDCLIRRGESRMGRRNRDCGGTLSSKGSLNVMESELQIPQEI